ncbi:MAG: hypothetical protein MUP33_09710, partial [Polaromonas sp.]|nr:hypothetical protein [Polaromonas sp.]
MSVIISPVVSSKATPAAANAAAASFAALMAKLDYLSPVPERLISDETAHVAHIKISKNADDSARVFWLNHPGHGEEK